MKQEFYYPSKDGQTQIHAIEWRPEGAPIAVLQMCHGMVEHIDRYSRFAQYLADHGFYVVGHDHLGHGKSVTAPEKLGFFHKGDGNDCVIGDIHALRLRTREKYPELPYFMMGHSMGSFLLRQYLGLYGEGVSGAIIMGTGDQASLTLRGGMLVCRLIALFKGWEHRSHFVNKMAMGGFKKEYGKAWLSRDTGNVDVYGKDPLCGFVFTVNAFYHMFEGMARMNKQEGAGRFPKTLPMLFVSGQEDPVGAHGAGVEAVYRRYQAHGAQKAAIKLYPEDRHEILNEMDRDTVYRDLLAFLQSNLPV